MKRVNVKIRGDQKMKKKSAMPKYDQKMKTVNVYNQGIIKN